MVWAKYALFEALDPYGKCLQLAVLPVGLGLGPAAGASDS